MHFESSQHPKTFSEGEGLKALSFGEGLGEDSFSFVKKRTPRYGEGFSIKGFLFF